jgi:hypothetical protein
MMAPAVIERIENCSQFKDDPDPRLASALSDSLAL